MSAVRALAIVTAACALLLAAPSSRAPAPSPSGAGAPPVRPVIHQVKRPLAFEENVGQAPADAQFVVHVGAVAALVSSTGLSTFVPQPSGELRPVRLHLPGAAKVKGEGLEPLPTRVNYLIGGDRSQWRTGVRTFARVVFREVWPGVDLVFHGTSGELEYDFVVHPGASPERIRLAFEGVEPVAAASGDLELTRGLVSRRPVSWQDGAAGRVAVASAYELRGREAGLRVGAHDAKATLVIDPVLSWGTYLGGTADEHVNGIAVDGAGAVYVTGYTKSALTFPTRLPWQGTYQTGTSDAFVTKYDSTGAMQWSTYLGGSGEDLGNDIGVDVNSSVYVVGQTDSSTSTFPLANAFQPSAGLGKDAFVVRLNAAGSGLDFGSFLGGSGDDVGTGLAVGNGGHVWVTGYTVSTNFPDTAGTTRRGSNEAFVARVNTAMGNLVFSKLICGQGNDFGNAVAVDAAGNAYVAGSTNSSPAEFFPITGGAYQASLSGPNDGFVVKVNAAGLIQYATYLGGSAQDYAYGIGVDSNGSASVAGYTVSTDFPVRSAGQAMRGAGDEAFVARLDTLGTSLVHSTYLGGSGMDRINRLAVDEFGVAWVTGYTTSSDFPSVNATQPTRKGLNDAFVTAVHPSGGPLLFSTYLGGSNNDFGNAIAVDGAQNVYVGGASASTNFPLEVAWQPDAGGLDDGTVVKLCCILDGGPGDGGLDAGFSDAGFSDAGVDAGAADAGSDAGSPFDGGGADASVSPGDGGQDASASFDGGGADAAVAVDSGTPDASVMVDAGVRDGGTTMLDGGLRDGGADAGSADAGRPDAGEADGGVPREPVVALGCGCDAGASGPVALLLLLALVRRARRVSPRR